MKTVTIRRCATCDMTKEQVDRLVADLGGGGGVEVKVVDGTKGQFAVDVDGRPVDGKNGGAVRDASDLAAEIRMAGRSA